MRPSRWMSSPWPDDALTGIFQDGSLTLQCKQGDRFYLDQRRWHDDASAADTAVLQRCRGAVLDVGCGPGRLVTALVRSGTVALGIDNSRAAVAAARRRGAPAVHTSVFGAVPWAGQWDCALLLDGNIGIGGDTRSLLERIRQLISSEGQLFVEVESPECASADLRVRVERDGRTGRWFPWSRVAATDVAVLAKSAGFVLDELWVESGRWFAELTPAVSQEAVAS